MSILTQVLRLEAGWLRLKLKPKQYQGIPATMHEAAREIEYRTNARSHAEHHMKRLVAFLGAWDFAELDPECAAQAEALVSDVNSMLAYGWPLSQYGHGSTKAEAPTGSVHVMHTSPAETKDRADG